jgi:putative N6-adenine-specific DNA methylase
MKKFFLICPIGFEQILIDELTYKWDMAFPNNDCTIMEETPGGVEIECEFEQGLLLNYLLKVPSKILLRIKGQKCRDLPKLYNIIKKINWKEYLQQENIEVKATSKESRLIHTTRITESVSKGLVDYFQANKLPVKTKELNKEYPPQKLFIRFNNDDLTISLDTSGELMHIREDRSYRGHASIRENMASALLIKLLGLEKKENITLIDPMCGTGTFLFEALNFHKLNDREFSFNFWKGSNNFKPEAIKLNSPWSFKKLIGHDIDNALIKINKGLNSEIQFECKDLFTHTNLPHSKETYVISNPPYGKRVKIEGNKNEFFKKIVESKIFKTNKGQSALIVPTPYENNLKGTKFYFNQNGIKVALLVS